jgi:hypothetical protein
MMHPDPEFARRIVGEIQERDLAPKPRWEFMAWNVLFFFLTFLTIMLGALTVATSAFLLVERDWDVSLEAGQHNALFTLQSLPYLWLAALMFLVTVTYSVFTRTRRGYRFAPVTVLGGTVLASLALGSGLYVIGAGPRTHNLARANIPAYDRIVITPERFWEHPEAGFLAGTVVSASSSSAFVLDDGKGNFWWVNVAENADLAIPAEQGARVRLIGIQTEPGVFEVRSLRAWHRPLPVMATSATY